MTTEPNTSDPAVAYEAAPSIIAEISWVTAQSSAFIRSEPDREFWLRKAAVFDRIAVKEAAMYVPGQTTDVVETAVEAARALVQYDLAHCGLSLKGAELVTDEDHREYVRHQYHEWCRAQHF
ncbi:hypothetical protein [Streptomyces sp. UNOC14_S4]|uniref:hypothetical protein n=1 Tax=Streptomyces sp. UNOC14_S4 TaxID=2872340 RepID=UPI001E2D826C|nr:hypothetical protein [Streptomyces sp. UNOC14_S4]MCC3772869.1 hypothetical protein [Streptomyces sp. UNOC14_S4]